MRIALFAQYYWPESVGAAIWLRQLATDLVTRGHQVSMVTAFPNYPTGKVFEGYSAKPFLRERVDGVEVIRTYIFASQRRNFWLRALCYGSFCASSLLGGMTLPRPDVIYCVIPPLPLGLTTELVGWAKRAPVVVNIQDVYPDIAVRLGYLRNRGAIHFFRAMEDSIYRHAAAIVVISEGFRQNLIAKRVPDTKLAIIPNWADGRELSPGPKENLFRGSLGLNGRLAVVYSGNLSHNSCLETLVLAMKLLEGEPFELIVVGDGVCKESLLRIAREQSATNIRFLPFQPLERYAEVLAGSDIQVVSLNPAASQLSLPSKVLKIMAAGRPVLALARPESDLAQLVRKAGCGTCVDPEDPVAAANALRRLNDCAILQRMGELGRASFEASFERASCVTRLEALLEKVAAR